MKEMAAQRKAEKSKADNSELADRTTGRQVKRKAEAIALSQLDKQ
jgi:hypothetical protein